ncbi:MAG: hypothetical protein FJZ00_14250, partial [Candidatus Sericytochromatia bacterium]|nr:hypothetical protein [Candidatus Tanganyikabacteria bacterium]
MRQPRKPQGKPPNPPAPWEVPGRRSGGETLSALPASNAPRPPIRRTRNLQLAGLDAFIKAVYPLIFVTTSEEGRFVARLREHYGQGRPIFQWTYTRGLMSLQDGRCVEPATIGDPLSALRHAERAPNSGMYIFCDLHPWLRDSTNAENKATIRMLRDFYHLVRSARERFKTVLLVSPVLTIPPELEKEVVVFDFPLPDREELRLLLDERLERGFRDTGDHPAIDPGHMDKLLEAATGLTLDEADNAFAAVLQGDGRLDTSDIHKILAQKQLIIRQSGVLDYYPADEELSEVGGLE